MYVTVSVPVSACQQWISVPFALANPAVSAITVTAVKQVYQAPWTGSINQKDIWVWLDTFCLLVNINIITKSFEYIVELNATVAADRKKHTESCPQGVYIY